MLGFDLNVIFTLLQQQALGFEAALILLQLFVFLGGLGLAVEARQLLVDFVDQISQALQVFTRMTNSILGLATPLLILGYTRGFFKVHAQLIRLGIDNTADHTLLDN